MLKKFYDFKSDVVLVAFSCCNLLLFAAMHFSPAPHNWIFWVTAAFRLIFPLVAFFFGKRGAWIAYFVFTNIQALDMSYDNFTAVAVLCVLFSLLPSVDKKKAIAITVLYLVDVFVVATLHNKSPYHIFVHLIGCICYCLAMWQVKVKRPAPVELSLLPDEEAILDQLASGVLIKNVEGFSENTIYSCLKKARERNGLKNNEELLLAFKSDKKKATISGDLRQRKN